MKQASLLRCTKRDGAAIPATCTICPICGATDVKVAPRKTIRVCRCVECKALWHVLPDAEPTAP